MKVSSSTYPKYSQDVTAWEKYRRVLEGGKTFIDSYLVRFSQTETATEFRERKRLTYNPAHAKSAFLDVCNSIFQRMTDISRKGGTQSYQEAILGNGVGVDRQSSTMNYFVGRQILPELLTTKRVAVFIDRAKDAATTRSASVNNPPYIYMYKAEDIRNFTRDSSGKLISILLRELIDQLDEETGLVEEQVYQYKLVRLTDAGVDVRFYDKDGNEKTELRALINLTELPVVMAEISHSLLTDIADYQIAMLNMASADVTYSCKSNFPFYTEQFDLATDAAERQIMRQAQAGDTSEALDPTRAKSVQVGVAKGRRYGKGLDRPEYIHPSDVPLRVSMAKQEQMKEEIRQLINLALTNIKPQRASAESKQKDSEGLENGLAAIGLELEYTERRIAKIWAMYEGAEEDAIITYPDKYSLKDMSERQKEAEKYLELAESVSSISFKREMAKKAIELLLGQRVSQSDMQVILDEIDKSEMPCYTVADLIKNCEEGILSHVTASKIQCFPDGDVDIAKKEHVERLAEIAKAQSSESNGAARGVADTSGAPAKDGKEEKDGKDGRGAVKEEGNDE